MQGGAGDNLLIDTEAKIGNLSRLGEANQLQTNRCSAGAIEAANPFAERHRRQMNQYLVDKAGLDRLPRDVGADEHYVLPTGRCLGHRAGDVFRQERDRWVVPDLLS